MEADEEEDDREYDNDGSGEEEGEGDLGLEGVSHSHLQAVTTITVPEIFPEVPVIPISRNPIFPKFVKMLEVCGVAAVPQTQQPGVSHSHSRSVTRASFN